MTRIFVLATLALIISIRSASCQSLISNRSVGFKVLRRSLSIRDDGSVIPSTYRIFVKMEAGRRDTLKTFSRKDWLNLLENDTTDWAANLVLYDLFKKDATGFAYGRIKDRSDWIKSGKYKDDLLYWKECLTRVEAEK